MTWRIVLASAMDAPIARMLEYAVTAPLIGTADEGGLDAGRGEHVAIIEHYRLGLTLEAAVTFLA